VLLPRDGSPHALSSHFAPDTAILEADLVIAPVAWRCCPMSRSATSQLDFKVGRHDLVLKAAAAGPEVSWRPGRLEVRLDSRGAVLEGVVEGRWRSGPCSRPATAAR
jgi:hypothetical protein